MMYRIALVVMATLSLSASASGQQPTHVILVTIDGFRPDFYMDPAWGAVNLREMKEMGVCAEGVQSVFPTLTFPNHTSIVTGVRPAKHGIYYNVDYEEQARKKAGKELYWYSRSIQVPTLWDAARAAGKITAAVNWPVAAGTDVDYNIPIIKGSGKTQLEVTAENSHPKGLMEEVQAFATGKLDNNSYNTNKDYLVIDENVARISGYLIRTYKPAFMAIRLSAVDHSEHEEGRDGPMVRKAVSGADRAVRTIIEAIQQCGISDSTTLIVTGDHGFVNTHSALSPNVWLREAGISETFISAGGSAFLRLENDPQGKKLQQIKSMLEERPAGERKLFRIIDKKEIDSMGADPKAVLALAAIPGITFSSADTGPSMRPVKAGTHGYFPDFREIQTGFVAYGAGLKKGLMIHQMETTDMALLVAALLNLTMENTDGVLYPGMLNFSPKK